MPDFTPSPTSEIEPTSARPGAVGGRPRRRDAARNRELLLDAAQSAFAAHGVDASLEQIARDAGLAVGTLYRHFPSRVDLLLAVFEPRVTALLDEIGRGMASDDPGDAFRIGMEILFERQAGDRGFSDFISMRFPKDPRTEPMHDRVCELVEALLQRAQDAGAVRPDINGADILALVWANGGILDATSRVAPEAWRRQLHLMLDSYRATNRHDLPAPPLTDDQLYEAMAQLRA